ncbi:MAG: methylated-DNA--[protein]-cysteine S-methyltransferase [Gammaproteobacteria bacterium]
MQKDMPHSRNPIFSISFPTPIGSMLAAATADGICLLDFDDAPAPSPDLKRICGLLNAEAVSGMNRHLENLIRQMGEYFDGERKTFDLSLVLAGTEFQKKAWKALLEIPYGETLSYQRQAERIERPAAVRAVANANRCNRIAVVVPCHRVIGKDGCLTGYAGGIWRKEYLLNLENADA